MELLENEGCDIHVPAAGFLEHKSKMTGDRNLDGALLLFALHICYSATRRVPHVMGSCSCLLFISTPRRHPLRAHTQ